MKFSFKLITLVVLLTTIQSCTLTTEAQKEKKVVPIKFLALGDSYTIGELVSKEDSWPYQLVNKLTNTDKVIDKPIIIAKTGWRTDQLLDSINRTNIEKEYDLVSIQIGVNNQYQGKTPNDFMVDFQEIIKKATTYGKNGIESILVVSIPDYSLTPFGRRLPNKKIGSEINAYNNVINEVCINLGIKFVDISEVANQVKSDNSLVANDKLHPNGKQYATWTKIIYPEVLSIINTSSAHK